MSKAFQTVAILGRYPDARVAAPMTLIADYLTAAGIGVIALPDAAATLQARTVVDTDLSAEADLIIKVKEPQAAELPLMRSGQLVFTYFHFAADETLTRNVLETGITAVAYETLEGPRGELTLQLDGRRSEP